MKKRKFISRLDNRIIKQPEQHNNNYSRSKIQSTNI